MNDQTQPPPQALEAELGLIGSAVTAAREVIPLAQKNGITDSSFFSPVHRAVWKFICELNDQPTRSVTGPDGKTRTLENVDPVTLTHFIRERDPDFCDRAQISGLLNKAIDATPTADHAGHYVAIVDRFAKKRRLIESAQKMVGLAFDPNLEPDAAGLQMIDEIAKLVKPRGDKTNAEYIEEVIAAWTIKHDAGIRAKNDPSFSVPLSGPSVGFADPEWNHKRWAGNLSEDDIGNFRGIDDILNGLQPGYYILAGRPSAGKTSFGNQIAINLALAGHHVASFTVDLPARRLLGRSVCHLAGISLAKLLKGWIRGDQWEKVLKAAEMLKTLPTMHIYQPPTPGLYEWASWLRLLHAKHGIKLATIDYVQQLRGKTRGQSIDDRMTEVSEVVKGLANELQIPILAYAQFNRQSELDSRPPTLADLRGSGSFEQDAMVAMLLYRMPRFFYDDDPAETYHASHCSAVICDIAKSQDGETAQIPLWFHRSYFKFQQAPPRFGLLEDDWKLCWNPKKFDEKMNPSR